MVRQGVVGPKPTVVVLVVREEVVGLKVAQMAVNRLELGEDVLTGDRVPSIESEHVIQSVRHY